MRKTWFNNLLAVRIILLVTIVLSGAESLSQAPAFYRRLPIEDFAAYAEGNHPTMMDSANNGVVIKKRVVVNGGNIGSNFFVNITDSGTYHSMIFSGNRFKAGIGNLFSQNVHVNNDSGVLWPALRAGNNNQFGINTPTPSGGMLYSKGNINIGSGSLVRGPVFVGVGYSYVGPAPYAGSILTDTSQKPVMPLLPYVTPFPPYTNGLINGTTTLAPGNYGDVIIGSGSAQTITFTTPGTYVFKSIQLTGRHIFNFQFPAGTTGYRIYVHGDVNLGQLRCFTNGSFHAQDSLAARIFMEVHGTGGAGAAGNSFILQDAANPLNSSWVGIVYAPFGGIKIGNTLPTYVSGGFWSKIKVEIGDQVNLAYYKLITPKSQIDPYYPAPTDGKETTLPKVGAELNSLINYRTTIDTITTNTIFRLDATTERVDIEVIAKDGFYNSAYNYLVSKGMTGIHPNVAGSLVIAGTFPIDSLSLLDSRPDIDHVRPLYVPLNNAGIVLSQGDSKMKSDLGRTGFNLTGDGVKIGVISDSYNTKGQATADVSSGDLPDDVQVVKEYPGSSATDEGRAMMQIVHDIAPSAKLAFRTGTVSSGDFAAGIKELASANLTGGACDIIVDDVTWPTEPFFRDGTVAKAVNEAKTQGVTYISAAGNFGTRAYEATFSNSGSSLDGSGALHSFGAATYQTLSLKTGSYMIVLQWDDDVYSLGGNNGTQTDLDMYLLEFSGTTLFGFNRNNIGGDPIEVLPFVVNEATEAKLVIVRASGTASPKFKFIIFRGDGTIVDNPGATSTLVGQANAEGALAIGAMLYDNNIAGYETTANTIASFSSRGGTQVYSNGQFSDRQKPDLIAPNGVNTKVDFGSTDIEGDDLPNFFGTSAAAPHAAGVAALIIEGKKKFLLQSTVTPDEIKSLLTSTAEDLYDPGYDAYSGYGLINAYAALRTLGKPTPSITKLYLTDSLNTTTKLDVPTTNNGFTVLAEGEFFEPDTKIYIDGAEVTTHYLNSTSAWAFVNAFTGNPVIKAYTPSSSTSGLDGNFSNEYKLYGNKRVISIKVNNAGRKFGENNPVFSSTITVDGVPIDSTNYTLAQLGLDKLVYSTTAVASSPVYTYPINASINLDSVADSALLADNVYQFNGAGVLTVNRLPVKITPQNKTITYGDDPGVVSYNYEFDQSSIADPSAMLDTLKTLHKNYLADNVLAVMHGFNDPQTNYGLSAADLTNMSTMASFQSIKNARRFKVVDGKLTTLTDSVADDEFGLQRMIVDVGAQSLYNYTTDSSTVNLVPSYTGEHDRSLINAKTLANGTAYVTVNGQLMAMVNGQLMAMVNENLMSVVNGQLMTMVNGQLETVESLVMQNGQLIAMVNGQLMAMVNGQLMAMVNGVTVNVDINSDIVEINGQLMAMVNGQLMAMVNGQLMSMVNGQLMAMVNGQLMAMVNGQLMAMVNGQLMAMVNGELTVVDNLSIQNGQLMAMVNGQLMAMVNGQLMAMVNGQLMAMVNGQLMAMVNGEVEFVEEVSMVNGQLMAMMNGQLMAMVNGQLMAMVNNEVVTLDNISIVNGQLMAMVNGQLMAMVNGQLMAMVNGSALGGTNSNTNSTVIIDQDDIDVQGGAIGGMASVNMITGLEVGVQKLIPGTFSDDNFEVTYGLGEVTINPAALTVTVKDTVRNYGDANPEFTMSITGYMNGDDSTSIAIPQATTTATSSSPVGTYAITASGGSAANYTFTYVNGSLDVKPVNLVVKVNDTTKVYGQPNPVFGLSATGFVNGDDLDDIELPVISTTATAASPVGVYPLNLSGGSSPNYIMQTVDGSLTINKAELLVKVADTSRAYGGQNPVFRTIITGFVNGDDGSAVILPSINTSATASSGVGTYPVTLGGGNADNYSLVLQDGVLTITPATLHITADNTSRVYGEQNPVFSSTITGFLNGDDENDIMLPQLTTTATQLSGVGQYLLSLSGGSAQNYQFDFAEGTLTIIPATLTLKANDLSKIYGEVNPALTITATGFVNGDGINDITLPLVATSATQSSAVGTYPITLAGGDAANYSITLQNGVLAVDKASLTLKADDKVKTYGYPNPSLTISATGFVNGDDMNDISVPQVSTAASQSSAVGIYPITLSGGSASNYNIVLQDGELKVDPAVLTITANNVSRLYGVANPALTMTASGFINGDGMNDITAPAISSNATIGSVPGVYPIVLTGGSAANYSIVLVNGTLVIGKVSLTITADLKVINQGQALPVFTSTIKGLLNGDVISGIVYSASGINTTVAGEYNNMPSVDIAAYPQYDITLKPGKLYVNPYGTGARKVIVKRQCVRKLIPAVNGYEYAAVFSYENPNNSPFYIPAGSDNKITVDNGGSFANDLPEVFQPGYHEITIFFSGHKMRWSVTSLGSTHSTANTAANNASSNCGGAVVSKNITVEKPGEELSVYPNPATRTIFITTTASELQLGNILITDVMGRVYPARIIHLYSTQTELDVANLKAGTYFIRVQTAKGEAKTLKFIKQ